MLTLDLPEWTLDQIKYYCCFHECNNECRFFIGKPEDSERRACFFCQNQDTPSRWDTHEEEFDV